MTKIYIVFEYGLHMDINFHSLFESR